MNYLIFKSLGVGEKKKKAAARIRWEYDNLTTAYDFYFIYFIFLNRQLLKARVSLLLYTTPRAFTTGPKPTKQ